MEKIFLFIGLLVFCGTFSLAQGKKENEAPSLNIEITVDGERFFVEEGDTLQVNDKSIVVKALEYKTFDYGVVRFDYPQKMAFSYEHDYEFRTWSLDRNNFAFLYYEFGVPIDLEELVRQMIKKFGHKNCFVYPTKMTLGGVELRGKRIEVDLMGQKLTYDLFPIEKNQLKTYVVSFQDIKDIDGSDSQDYREAMKIISSTFKIL